MNPATALYEQPQASTARASEIGALDNVFELVGDDFAAINRLIPNQLTSDVALVEEIGRYIVESGGKRLRPLLVLLSARGCGYDGQRHVVLAAVIEFLHTASLLHDDVVDKSDLRRGRPTANACWGNAPSVLVGDFLYSRAFQLMVALEDMQILAILADATNRIAEGEVMQFANIGNLDITEERYLEAIRRKTALLFQAATHTGAVLAGQTPEAAQETEAHKQFGLHFGLAYQLVDDWLDYAGDARTMGKNAGNDLAEGKLTLPLICALAHGTESQAALIRDSLRTRSRERFDRVVAAVHACGAMDYTHAAALAASDRALACLEQLPANRYREAMGAVTRFAISRLF